MPTSPASVLRGAEGEADQTPKQLVPAAVCSAAKNRERIPLARVTDDSSHLGGAWQGLAVSATFAHLAHQL